MQTLMHVEEPVGGPVRSLWRAAHRPVEGVSRRVQLLGYAVPFTALPAALWRLPIVFDGEFGIGERVYVVALSVVSEALAFAAVGLVAWWGEVFPRWVPVLRGRRVPVAVGVVPAAFGAAVLTLLFTVLNIVSEVRGTTIRGDAQFASDPSRVGGWETFWYYVCYSPLVLWGPLLGVVTFAYWKRRRAGVSR
ncbi:hypothetical protein [Streptomyces sp. NBC_01465]|uniref:hypothetical protein n=1 Tax=Streptomyces sp. NBC_01465 TaxID=2903878 RepID=UPI002E33FF0D|nr:hypothetical protein [Streptomyces sp. NBC_01465]